MKEGFFEGEDFGKGVFRALTPMYYTPKYKKYIEEEKKLLKKEVHGSNRVLEAGVGTGRLIPELAPLVKEFVGVDIARLMLKKSREVAKAFSNVQILECDLTKLSQKFEENYFDKTLCVWNTLGNVGDSEILILKELAKVTSGSIFVTVFKKEHHEDRKELYRAIGVELKDIDEENEIYYTKSGLESKSYSLEDIQNVATKAGLEIVDHRVLGEVILYVELKKR